MFNVLFPIFQIFQIAFLMKYDYRNMTTALQSDNKEPELVWLQHPVYIDLGPLVAKA